MSRSSALPGPGVPPAISALPGKERYFEFERFAWV
jgi:hypothetical protein